MLISWSIKLHVSVWVKNLTQFFIHSPPPPIFIIYLFIIIILLDTPKELSFALKSNFMLESRY